MMNIIQKRFLEFMKSFSTSEFLKRTLPVMKYEISEYTQTVINDMKDGWRLKYDTSQSPPHTYLQKGDEIKSISNWTLTVLWENNMVFTDKKSPVSSYHLSGPVLNEQYVPRSGDK